MWDDCEGMLVLFLGCYSLRSDQGFQVVITDIYFILRARCVQGLTEKFKEKDTRYTGSAALTYDGFLSMVIPFIVP
jgi:hypothetical protein